MMRLLFSILMLAALCLPAAAAEQTDFIKGKNYHEIARPKQYQKSDKIEVIMFLWYGCGGCYKLDKTITDWAQTLPDDVDFKRLPGMFLDKAKLHGRVFLTMEAMGATYEKHHSIFDLLKKDNFPLETEADLPAFIEKIGVDKDEFMKIYKSEAITEKLEDTLILLDDYGITDVPSMAINGRYHYSVKDVEGSRYVKLADYLIDLERKAKTR